MSDPAQSIRAASCADDYDPNSMPVAKAREFIARFLKPVSAVERLHIRSALGRVLAADVISPLNVPSNDNSAMDGYAVRFADLKADGDTRLKIAGTAFAGVPFQGSAKHGECVRIMTGAVMPAGLDTIVMQEHAKADGDHATTRTAMERLSETTQDLAPHDRAYFVQALKQLAQATEAAP